MIALANHLWQSTAFAVAAGLLTLALRKNRAAVRFSLWLAASVKFLIPFSWLVRFGSLFEWRAAPASAAPQVAFVMETIGQPFSEQAAAIAPSSIDFSAVLLIVWVCGFGFVAVRWLIGWLRMRQALLSATPLPLSLPIPARATRSQLEPGVLGIFRPILLLPEGIADRLPPRQLDAIVAHEMCHVKRRDNLAGAIHMLVEAIFWFHPLVWWIESRLVEERELACDEEVLSRAGDPNVYAEGILNVCRFYVGSPLACASGVTGADLKRRIESIMANRVARRLNAARKMLLVAVACLAVAAPVAIGVLGARPARGQAETAPPAFEAASVKVHPDSGRRDRTRTIEPGRITYLDVTLGELIAVAYDLKRYQISGPGWIVSLSSSDAYDVIATAGRAAPAAEVRRMLGPLLADRFHLVFHRETRELAVYALFAGKGGPKFSKPGDGTPAIGPDGEGGFYFRNYSMDGLANWLSLLPTVGRPVIDRTGVAGNFNFRANLFNLEKGTPPDQLKRAMADGDAGDTLRATLPDQLGLRLEPQKAPIEVLVIDHADKVPSEN